MVNMNANTGNRGRCGCGNDNSRGRLLRKVQQHGFAMLEAGLYLDGHPNCRQALEYFARQRDLYLKYADEYEAKYGALTMMSETNCNTWNWVQGPWPWESEAN